MNILFIATVRIVVQDAVTNRKLFKDALGLSIERHEGDEYFFSENIAGSKHFGLWPLSQAARSLLRDTGMAGKPADSSTLHRI